MYNNYDYYDYDIMETYNDYEYTCPEGVDTFTGLVEFEEWEVEYNER